MIVGTAGHIDHGKTALVKALTGIDDDRLAEEKRRGITIDLGFAHLELPGQNGETIRLGFVDVRLRRRPPRVELRELLADRGQPRLLRRRGDADERRRVALLAIEPGLGRLTEPGR